jgi:membrane-associated phospholipid phosphatase
MARLKIRATQFDRSIAEAVVRNANPKVERTLRSLTLLADERVLLALSVLLWVSTRMARPRLRREADHLLANVAVTSLVPHLLKRLVAQERPDRCEVHGARHGIPRSGNAYDAFPSGHAMHMGAISAAQSRFYPRAAALGWSIGALLAGTRILLLAHWTTDVIAGFWLGGVIESVVWRLSQRMRRRRSAETASKPCR